MNAIYNPNVLIIGGGIAGLWLLDDLRRNGYSAILVEKSALGTGQTIATQGILHGGLKHLLVGRQGSFVSALNEMPNTWRQFLAGTQEPNLQDVSIRGAHCYFWRTSSLASIIGQFGAKHAANTSINLVPQDQRPNPLQHCPGDVFQIEEQVVDPKTLLQSFRTRNFDRLLLSHEIHIEHVSSGQVLYVDVFHSDSKIRMYPHTTVFTAGEGNDQLREKCGLSSPAMKLLPLSILTISGDLPNLNGFCLEGKRAKVVITTQHDGDNTVWQVASECVASDQKERFQERVWKELSEALPNFAWPDVECTPYFTNRAEMDSTTSARPGDVSILREGNTITAWPTKLVLSPRLSQKIMEHLPPPSPCGLLPEDIRAWPKPEVAFFPWETP